MNTRDLIEIKRIENNFYVLDDDTYCCVIEVKGVQFFLMDYESQQIIINQFQGLLNALDFQIQFLIMTRKTELSEYLEYLKSFRGKQSNDLLKIQFEDYFEFINSLIKESNIMKRSFYIIITLKPEELGAAGVIKKDKEREILNLLFQRVDIILRSLEPMGVEPKIVEGDNLLNFLYNCYNPNIFYVEKADTIKKFFEILKNQK
jgi:hypothetical protein